MTFEEWLAKIPKTLIEDSLWNWYFKGRNVLGEAEALSRMELLTEIIRLVLTMLPQQRGSSLREEIAPYGTDEA
jgi:hypothetical protein